MNNKCSKNGIKREGESCTLNNNCIYPNCMKEIEPKYLTLKQVKLLKEKNYKIETQEILFYRDEVNNTKYHQEKNKDIVYDAISFNYELSEDEYRTYHIWEFVEWLLINHQIYLWVKPYADRNTFQPYWVYMNEKSKDAPLEYHLSGNASISGSDYKTPQKAYLAAIDYILNNNLI
jgi:hypothetical protein